MDKLTKFLIIFLVVALICVPLALAPDVVLTTGLVDYETGDDSQTDGWIHRGTYSTRNVHGAYAHTGSYGCTFFGGIVGTNGKPAGVVQYNATPTGADRLNYSCYWRLPSGYGPQPGEFHGFLILSQGAGISWPSAGDYDINGSIFKTGLWRNNTSPFTYHPAAFSDEQDSWGFGAAVSFSEDTWYKWEIEIDDTGFTVEMDDVQVHTNSTGGGWQMTLLNETRHLLWGCYRLRIPSDAFGWDTEIHFDDIEWTLYQTPAPPVTPPGPVYDYGGWPQFIIGIAGLIMIGSSWVFLKVFWSKDEYATALGAWFCLLLLGIAFFTVLLGG